MLLLEWKPGNEIAWPNDHDLVDTESKELHAWVRHTDDRFRVMFYYSTRFPQGQHFDTLEKAQAYAETLVRMSL